MLEQIVDSARGFASIYVLADRAKMIAELKFSWEISDRADRRLVSQGL